MNEETLISKLVDGSSATVSPPLSRIDKILGTMTGDYTGDLDPSMSQIENELIRIKDQVANSKDETANSDKLDKINGEVI